MELRTKLLIIAFLIEGFVFLLAVLLAWLFDILLLPLSKDLFRDVLMGTFWALFPLALFVFSVSDTAKTVPLLGSVRNTLIAEIKMLFSATRLLDIVVISVLAGFAEELLFRGVIQVKMGIIAASIMFGFLHCVTPAYVVIATIIGFYIGIIYHLYQSLLVPIQLHCIYDFGALVYLKYFIKEQENLDKIQ